MLSSSLFQGCIFGLWLIQYRALGAPDGRHLLRLYEVADGKHDVGEDGNPNSIRGDVWNCRQSADHSDHSD